MNSIIEKGKLIARIRDGKDLDQILAYAKEQLYCNGPVDTVILEILSYLKLFQKDYFTLHENEIVETMGLFYKNPRPETLQSAIFDMYRQHIKETFGEDYTPLQANILKHIQEKQFFSFSAPTSTGKSYVFRNLIKSSKNDVVVIVPSRALINEYYDRITELVDLKVTNVLTFVEHINTKHALRNVFILTPERARELFKNKSWLKIDLFLFDEAQLSDEHSVRGLYFDSIVRRAQKAFSQSKFVFAHPFISNPEAQLKRNDVIDTGASNNYLLKTVGQVFYVHDATNQKFYHFGSDKKLLGERKIESQIDPIEQAIMSGGSVLIYVPKKHIYDKSIYRQFSKYINLCTRIQDPEAIHMIEQLRSYIGASNRTQYFYNSDMLDKLQYGIVIHHGSMPLNARLILEHFTQKRFCKICFATSTLEQGINMPFDVVYLDKFEASKSLSVKNLIGRAGRSTRKNAFDVGSVVMRNNAMSSFRNLVFKNEIISEISHLDKEDDQLDEKYNEYKDAIKNDEFSDEYNLTNKDLEKLKADDVTTIIPTLLDMMFVDGQLISPDTEMKDIYDDFQSLYRGYLGRELVTAEKAVLSTAIKIMIWKVYGRTFSSICQYRYAYASKVNERRKLIKEKRTQEADALCARYISGYQDLPNKQLQSYPLVSLSEKAKNVDYDLIVYDTYDFLDKLIGFKLSDLFYAIFHQYYKQTEDQRALRLAKYFKFGTDNDKEIWMLRYGLSFEDIEWAGSCIDNIGEEEIVFNEGVENLVEEQRAIIEPYINK